MQKWKEGLQALKAFGGWLKKEDGGGGWEEQKQDNEQPSSMGTAEAQPAARVSCATGQLKKKKKTEEKFKT